MSNMKKEVKQITEELKAVFGDFGDIINISFDFDSDGNPLFVMINFDYDEDEDEFIREVIPDKPKKDYDPF